QPNRPRLEIDRPLSRPSAKSERAGRNGQLSRESVAGGAKIEPACGIGLALGKASRIRGEGRHGCVEFRHEAEANALSLRLQADESLAADDLAEIFPGDFEEEIVRMLGIRRHRAQVQPQLVARCRPLKRSGKDVGDVVNGIARRECGGGETAQEYSDEARSLHKPSKGTNNEIRTRNSASHPDLKPL